MPQAVESTLAIAAFPPLGSVRVRVEERRVINKRDGSKRVVVGLAGSPINFQVRPEQLIQNADGCWVAGVLIDRCKEPGRQFGWHFFGRVEVDCVEKPRQLNIPKHHLVAA